jgi:hypothetical protein
VCGELYTRRNHRALDICRRAVVMSVQSGILVRVDLLVEVPLISGARCQRLTRTACGRALPTTMLSVSSEEHDCLVVSYGCVFGRVALAILDSTIGVVSGRLLSVQTALDPRNARRPPRAASSSRRFLAGGDLVYDQLARCVARDIFCRISSHPSWASLPDTSERRRCWMSRCPAPNGGHRMGRVPPTVDSWAGQLPRAKFRSRGRKLSGRGQRCVCVKGGSFPVRVNSRTAYLWVEPQTTDRSC